MVGVRHGRGFCATRVDHDQPAATRLHGAGLALEVRYRPHAAVAGQRVGADHQQQVGAHDVGQRHRQPVAKHQSAGQLLGHLVQGGGRKHVFAAQRPGQLAKVAHQADLVRRRVAHHHRGGIASVQGDHWRQPAFDLGKGLVPAGRHMHAVAFDQRCAQPIRVFVQVFQRHALGANVPGAEHVLRVAPDADDAALLHLDLQPATGFTQRADTVVGGVGHAGLGLLGSGR